MGRYVSQPLTIKCGTIAGVREFLIGCKYVSDKELFGKDDYWRPRNLKRESKVIAKTSLCGHGATVSDGL